MLRLYIKNNFHTSHINFIKKFLIYLSYFFLSTNTLFSENKNLVYTFRNFQSKISEKMFVVGILISKTKEKIDKDETEEYDTRNEHALVKIIDDESSEVNYKIGQTLYILDKGLNETKEKNANIIGEVTLTSILKNKNSKPYALGVKGNLLRVRVGRIVARSDVNEKFQNAYALKREGDSFFEQGNYS